MTSQDRPRFEAALIALASALRAEMDAVGLATYWSVFRAMPLAAVQHACRRAARECRWMPKPAELMELAEDYAVDRDQQADEQAQAIAEREAAEWQRDSIRRSLVRTTQWHRNRVHQLYKERRSADPEDYRDIIDGDGEPGSVPLKELILRAQRAYGGRACKAGEEMPAATEFEEKMVEKTCCGLVRCWAREAK